MSEFDARYELRNAIKAQALVEFIQEMTVDKSPEQKWLIYLDDSSAVGGSGGGIILVSPYGDQSEYAAKF